MKHSSYKGHVWIDQKIYFEFQTQDSTSPEQFVEKLQSLKSEEIDGLFAVALESFIQDYGIEDDKFFVVIETMTNVEATYYSGHIGYFDPPDSYAPDYDILGGNSIPDKGEEIPNKKEIKTKILKEMNKKFNGVVKDLDFYGEDITEQIYEKMNQGEVYDDNYKSWREMWYEEQMPD